MYPTTGSASLSLCCCCSQLQEVNDVLRAKEAMQFDMLTGYEDSMSRMCSMLCELAQQQDAGRTDTDETVQVLSGVMLALRDSAQELLQQLEPSTSSDNDPSHSASHSDGSARSSNSSGSLPPMGACCGRHMQRLWSRITPQAVLDMRRVSACQLAGERAMACSLLCCYNCAGATSYATHGLQSRSLDVRTAAPTIAV